MTAPDTGPDTAPATAPLIRRLDPVTDRAAVDGFFRSIADYIRMERDEDPGPTVTDEFFGDAPPGCDPADSHRLGLFVAGELVALAEMAPSYPDPESAYLGFLAVSSQVRGGGWGRLLLQGVEARARAGGASVLYLAVLEANPRGRAFWEREAFRLHSANLPVTLGAKTQMAHRLCKPL